MAVPPPPPPLPTAPTQVDRPLGMPPPPPPPRPTANRDDEDTRRMPPPPSRRPVFVTDSQGRRVVRFLPPPPPRERLYEGLWLDTRNQLLEAVEERDSLRGRVERLEHDNSELEREIVTLTRRLNQMSTRELLESGLNAPRQAHHSGGEGRGGRSAARVREEELNKELDTYRRGAD